MRNFQQVWAEWEQKRNMFDIVFENCYLWEYIRFNLYVIVAHKINGENNGYYYYIPSNNSSKYIDFNDLCYKKKDILFLNMSRRQLVNGELVSPFLDGLLNSLKYSYYVLEIRNKEEQSENIKTPNIRYLQLDKISCAYKSNEDHVLCGDKIIKRIEHDFKIVFSERDKSEVYNVIASVVSNRNRFYMYFKYILTLVRPKVVIVLGYCLQYVGYMIEVAKEMGIPIIEYMHGVSGFLVYMARTLGDKQYICPDYIFTYSDYEKEYIDFPIKKRNVIPVGNVYHENRVKWCLENICKNKEKKKIMYISDNIVNNNVIAYLKELMHYLGDEYSLVIKIRPNEPWKKKYKDLLDIGANVVGNYGENDIYGYLTDVDYLIGTVSTVFAEASELPIIKIMIKTKYSVSSVMYLDNCFAVSYNSARDLADMILNNKLQISCKKFYHSNPEISFNNAIKKVINDRTKK